MSLKNLSVSCGLPRQTIKLFKSEGYINDFGDSPENAAKIEALKYLFMSRFSPSQVRTMFTEPDSIGATVKAHANELSHSERPYPTLIRILNGVDLSEVHDIFALGGKIDELFVLPLDYSHAISDLKKSCGEIEILLLQARKYHRAESALNPIAMLFLIGIPFGFIRSLILSRMSDMMDSVDKLNRPFAEALSKIEPFLDFTLLSYHKGFENRNYGVAVPDAAAVSYSLDVDEKFDFYWERLYSVKRLLDGLKFSNEAKV